MDNILKSTVATYLLIVNIIAFTMMLLDKSCAKFRKPRIPEAILLMIAFIGGAFGELLGMFTFRHKTRHLKFTICVPLFLTLHIITICFKLT